MKKLRANIEFKNPDQIISMGGPWVGELYFDKLKVSDNVILDNIIQDEIKDRLYFIKYNLNGSGKREYYFSINFLDVHAKDVYMFDMKFNKVYIKHLSNEDSLTFYRAFHDSIEKFRDVLNLNSLDMILLKSLNEESNK